MPVTIEQITQQVLTLSESERARLVQALLHSLDPAPEEGVAEAWETEVTQRAVRVCEGSAQGRPADDVFRDISGRHEK